MAKTKVYGVVGLIEWKPVIHAGRATFSPLFKGGQLSGFGITPATYKTSDPIEQHIIEHCEYFKSKRIEHLYDLGDNDEGNEDEGPKRTGEESYVKLAPRVVRSEPDEATEKDSGLEKVEFASLGDARNYLYDKFGVEKNTIPNRASVLRVANSHGIEIVFNE